MLVKVTFLLLSLLIIGCGTPPASTDPKSDSYSVIEHEGTLWMAENLRSTHDQSGNLITYYYPNDDPDNALTYGLLYDYETACRVCPFGWELPSGEDWEHLLGSLPAGEWKDPILWDEPGNTNSKGFSVKPTGYANQGSYDNYFGTRTLFWSKSEESENIRTFIFEKGKDQVRSAEQHPTYAFAVRCIRKRN